MDALAFLRVYVATNIAFACAWGLMALAARYGDRAMPISFAAQLRFGYAALIVAVLMPLAGALGAGEYAPQTAQVWSAATMQELAPLPSDTHRVTMSLAPMSLAVRLDRMSSALTLALLLGCAMALFRVTYGVVATWRVIRNAQLVRQRSALRILSSDEIAVPFSFWLPSRYFVVVPTSLLSQPLDLRLALRHEVQHHRQGDTKMLYAFQLLLGVCFWNPALYALTSRLRQLQEFACDEALLVRGGTRPIDYCACLLRVAEHCCGSRTPLVAMSMADSNKTIFIRRIERMLNRPQKYMHRTKVVLLAVAGAAALSMAAATIAATVKDRRISAADARQMAEVAQANSTFPILVNDSVVQELNRYLGTPDGRKFVRESLARMTAHREIISAKLQQYSLPRELMAVPLVESGFRNLPQSRNATHGAGLWMFIAPTARKYSLRVDERTDDRLDVAAETDAAMRMFSDLYRHFGDWGLALLAYNAGNALVEQGMRETGSRDVWRIVGEGYENDRDYMPRMMAAILIMNSPGIAD